MHNSQVVLDIYIGTKWGLNITPRAKSPRGIAIMVAGIVGHRSSVGRSACAMSVVMHFFVQFFSYDPEILHLWSPPYAASLINVW